MAWNHDDVGPNRSRDELLGDVVRRGERIRRRRRAAAGLGGGLASLALVGLVTVVGTGEPTTELATAGRSTTTGAHAGPATGGTIFAVEVPGPTVETTATTLVPVTTEVEPTVTTAAPATTLPPGPAQPRCGPAVLQAAITMAPTFAAGEPVTGEAVLRNTSGGPCFYYSYTAGQEITDLDGNQVVPGSVLIADAFEDTPFAAGQTLTQPVSWAASVPGSYRATVRWSFDGPPVEVSATFTVT